MPSTMVKGSGGTWWPVVSLPPSPKAPRQASGLTPPACLRVAVAAGHPDGTHLDTLTGAVGAARSGAPDLPGDPQHAPGPRLRLRPILGVKPESSQVPSPRTGGAWQEGPESTRGPRGPLAPAISFLCPRTRGTQSQEEEQFCPARMLKFGLVRQQAPARAPRLASRSAAVAGGPRT